MLNELQQLREAAEGMFNAGHHLAAKRSYRAARIGIRKGDLATANFCARAAPSRS